jgi:[ribosomal protein S5]-alanine N-acetyltransferase
MNYPFRTGSRVYLRALEPEDIEHCLRWFNDPLITRHIDAGALPIDRQSQAELMENVRKDDKRIVMAICREENDLHIGNIGFHDISPVHRRAELGLVIGERTLHRKGYGTDALKLMITYGFDSLNLERIFLRVMSSNEAAVGCYEKLGFQREAVLRQQTYREGSYFDEIVMGLLKEEWAVQQTE